MQRPLLRNRFFYTSYFWIFRIAADRFSRRKYRTVKGIERMEEVPDRPVFMETCVFACRFGFGPVAERGHRLRGCRKREWGVWRTEFLHFVPVGCGIG